MARIIRSPEFDGSSKLLDVKAMIRSKGEFVDSSDNSPGIKLSNEQVELEKQSDENNLQLELEQRNDQLNKKIDELQEEIVNLERESYDKEFSSGYQDGYKTGFDAANDEFDHKMLAISNLFERIDSEVQKYLSSLEDINVEIIFSAVCKIIGKNSENPEYILNLVREYVRKFDRKENIVVHFSPGDYQLLIESGNFDKEVKKLGNFQFIESEHITYGGCFIDSKNGGLDARLETQVQRFKDMLLEVYSRRSFRKS